MVNASLLKSNKIYKILP